MCFFTAIVFSISEQKILKFNEVFENISLGLLNDNILSIKGITMLNNTKSMILETMKQALFNKKLILSKDLKEAQNKFDALNSIYNLHIKEI